MGRDALQPEHSAEQSTERAIVCAACRHVLARARDRIEVSGRHEHTCVNPAGIVFVIQCFANALGCVPFGARETYFSWFADHAWRIALCGGCAAHVGWSFEGTSTFHGLIADRIA